MILSNTVVAKVLCNVEALQQDRYNICTPILQMFPSVTMEHTTAVAMPSVLKVMVATTALVSQGTKEMAPTAQVSCNTLTSIVF